MPRRTSSPLPWRTLDRPLSPTERRAVERAIRGLLHWQLHLTSFPRVTGRVPDATPFVSLYAGGTLRGCFGADEGTPAERLARAFLLALNDSRYGLVRPDEREGLVAQVSYIKNPVLLPKGSEIGALEVGTHGVAAVGQLGGVNLLPQVARDHGLDGTSLLRALAGKARSALSDATLYAFETVDMVVHRRPHDRAKASESLLAERWLAHLVRKDGAIDFGVDPRARKRDRHGIMAHGRSAVVIQALAASGRYDDLVTSARRRMRRDIRRALSGTHVEAWPGDPAMVAGTLALALRAGVDVRSELIEFSRATPLTSSPWHAGQVVAALGHDAPKPLLGLCEKDFAARPFAPWTLLAARAVGSSALIERAERALVAALRKGAPHVGGADITAIPEVAQTAIAVEALSPSTSREARSAVERGRSFLRKWQLLPDQISASLDPEMAEGAFPLSPVAGYLRGDATAHALLALHDSPR